MIIGSTALRYHFPFQREPKDLDVFSPYTHAPTDEHGRKIERFWDDRLYDYLGMGTCGYASIDELYTIKVSHSYWEIGNSWGKHISDVQFLKAQGAMLIQPFHDILYGIWESRYGAKKMRFMDKDSFFKDAVHRVYDHDSIHDSVAYDGEAMYRQTLHREGHTAVDMSYIKGMPFEDQVKLYREEVCATALERLMIPAGYKGSAGAAYLWALRRTITSLTKGWSAQFIVTNYEHFSKPCDYLARHLANKERLILL